MDKDTAASPLPIASLLKRGEIKVLVIEDDKFLLEVIATKLHGEGFKVLEAPDGEGGIRVASSEAPHLIILDLLLPLMDGFEVLEKLRAQKELAKIPVLVLSNLNSPEDMERARQLGAKEYLVKAHNTPEEIMEKIKQVLERFYLP